VNGASVGPGLLVTTNGRLETVRDDARVTEPCRAHPSPAELLIRHQAGQDCRTGGIDGQAAVF
jgi:hypothetical protein